MYIDPEQQQSPLAPRDTRQHEMVRRLRSLPQEIGQPYDWAEFQRRARQRATANTRRSESIRRSVALAAALVLVVVGVAVLVRVMRPGIARPVESYVSLEVDSSPPVVLDVTEPPDGTQVRARAAERWLASLPSEPVVVRVGTRAAVTGLEDRIAQLDDVLSAARVAGTQPVGVAALQEQRVRLVDSLVQVRYAETLVSESR